MRNKNKQLLTIRRSYFIDSDPMQFSTSYEPTATLSRSPVTQKLGDENYFKWSFEMEMYLTREELWDNVLFTEDEYEEYLID